MARDKVLLLCQRALLHPRLRWAHDPQLWIELFAAANLAILAADIYIAHSVNQFRNPAEYIPLYFSFCAGALIFVVIALRWIWGFQAPWRDIGYLVGWASVLIGMGGVIYHLHSRFFVDRTLRSLTYAAPFAAPLAYTGLGFLLVMNRSVPSRSSEWAKWVILLALGGFFGNFVLSLTDHAENGFFLKTEWIPVISSALAAGFLLVPLILPVARRFLDLCLIAMGLQIVVGLLGFWFHVRANLIEPGVSLFDKLVNGAPPMAPLLFPNLAVLAFIGLWALIPHLQEAAPGHSWLGSAWAWAHPED
jgi:hypothetical protein